MHLAMLLLSATLTVAQADRPSYVLVTPSDTSTYGSFTTDEIEMIRDVYGPRVFFFRSNARAYVIFDEKVIASVDDLFRPQRELGQRQAELGAKQAALGAKQAALGARQAVATPARQGDLSREQQKLSAEQSALGDVQAHLGEQQSELSREVGRKLSTLTEEWIRSGVAKPLQR